MRKKTLITEKNFHKLWEMALSENNIDTFCKNSLHSKEYRTMIKNGFSMDMFYETIQVIYIMAHISISHLLDKYKIKTSTLSHKLCIPQKTIEHWKYGNRECPPYMKLIILNTFNIKWLPEYTKIENGMEKPQYKKIYNKKNKNAQTITQNETHIPSIENKEENVFINRNIHNNKPDNNEQMEDTSKHMRLWSLKEYEQAHVYNETQSVKALINSTNYIDEILKKKKQGTTTS